MASAWQNVRPEHGPEVKRNTIVWHLWDEQERKTQRLGEDFLIWADEDTIIKVILNTYKFVKEYIDPNAPGGKEHVGYIIDRVGFAEYKKWALDGVELPPETIVKNNIYWSGIHYR